VDDDAFDNGDNGFDKEDDAAIFVAADSTTAESSWAPENVEVVVVVVVAEVETTRGDVAFGAFGMDGGGTDWDRRFFVLVAITILSCLVGGGVLSSVANGHHRLPTATKTTRRQFP
jgi:hypothetical protein